MRTISYRQHSKLHGESSTKFRGTIRFRGFTPWREMSSATMTVRIIAVRRFWSGFPFQNPIPLRANRTTLVSKLSERLSPLLKRTIKNSSYSSPGTV